MTEPLAREIATYDREKPRLESKHVGAVVLIHGDEVIGTFATVQQAAEDGIRRFGEQPFLVRRIAAQPLKLSFAVLYGMTHVGDPIHLSIP